MKIDKLVRDLLVSTGLQSSWQILQCVEPHHELVLQESVDEERLRLVLIDIKADLMEVCSTSAGTRLSALWSVAKCTLDAEHYEAFRLATQDDRTEIMPRDVAIAKISPVRLTGAQVSFRADGDLFKFLSEYVDEISAGVFSRNLPAALTHVEFIPENPEFTQQDGESLSSFLLKIFTTLQVLDNVIYAWLRSTGSDEILGVINDTGIRVLNTLEGVGEDF